jgi:octaprenyl-diphosphate synthase
MPTLTQLQEPIAAHLKRVATIFEQALLSDLPCVDDLCRHVRHLRGKMLRPVLLLTAGQACGELTDEHYTLAAVVEMVHMATLVHDDVLDEASLRRGAVTVNHMSGNETAVMLGDFLISRSFRLGSSIGSQTASQLVAQAAATVCEGELLQLYNRGNWDLDEQTYLTIIDRKTAALTAVSCKLGAIHAGAESGIIDDLEEYGRQVGLAFQIVDDILDIVGRQDQAGKTLGTDAKLGKLTLPLIHFLRQASNSDRRDLLAMLQAGGDRTTLPQVLERYGSLASARQQARGHVVGAVELLECLPDSPARRQLRHMAEFIVEREF